MRNTAVLIMGILGACIIGAAVAYFFAPPQSAVLPAPELSLDDISQD